MPKPWQPLNALIAAEHALVCGGTGLMSTPPEWGDPCT